MKTHWAKLISIVVFLLIAGRGAAIQTAIIDIKTTGGGTADQTVTITRNTTGSMIFADDDLADTYTLRQLTEGGVSDHGDLTGTEDDDHDQYYNWTRLHNKLGVGDNASSVTTGALFNKFIVTPADPAGMTTLGTHTTGPLLHWHRPSRIVTVGKDDTTKSCEYTTIQGAIDSITGATATNPWVVLIYPGRYEGGVTLDEDYVALVGVLGSGIMTPENLVKITCEAEGQVPLNITATNPGPIVNLYFEQQLPNSNAVEDSGVATIFRNCKFKTNRGSIAIGAYRSTSAGEAHFYDCLFNDNGAAGVDTYSVVIKDAGSVKTLMFYRCFFSVITKADHAILTDVDSAGVIAEFHSPRFALAHSDPASHGCFNLEHASSKIYLYSANFQSNAIVINPNSTNGTIYFAHVQTEDWGSPTSGLTTTPIELSGGKMISDLNLGDFARLLIEGVVTINDKRDGFFRNLLAQDATFSTVTTAYIAISTASLTVASLNVGSDYSATTGSIVSSGPVTTVALEFTTQTEAAETDRGFSRIETTSDSLAVILDRDGVYGGSGAFKVDGGGFVFNDDSGDYDFRIEGNGEANLFFVDAGDDEVGIGTNAPDKQFEVYRDAQSYVEIGGTGAGTGYGLYVYRNKSSAVSDAPLVRFHQAAGSEDQPVLQLSHYNDARKCLQIFHNVTEKSVWLASGYLGILDTSPASPLTVGNGEKFQVGTGGNVSLAAGVGIAIADDGTSGPWTTTFGASYTINPERSTNENMGGNVGVELVTAAGAWYFAIHMPCRAAGKPVVLDRLVLHVYAADATDYIDTAEVVSMTPDGSETVVAQDTTNRTAPGSYNMLSSDLTLYDNIFYSLKLTLVHGGDNDFGFGSFTVHGHTE